VSVHAFAERGRKETASPPARAGPDRRPAPSPLHSNHAFGSVLVRAGGGNPDAGTEAPAVEAVPATPIPGATPQTAPTAPVAQAPLSWTFVKTHTWDALWYFCGQHPSGFSTTVLLRAGGFGAAAGLRWSIPRGSDKVELTGGATGPEVHVRSKAGSTRLDDITVRVTDGAGAGAPSYDGTLTVRKPHRLLHRFTRHHANCPAFDATCPAGAAAHWTEIGYRVVDNVGGTIVGATVNENFPSPKVNDQANTWTSPAAFSSTSVWRNTDGTFIDFWWVWGNTPLPVNPGDPHDNDSVDRLAHEFYVGGTTSGTGCRVQTHTAHRYLGHTEHENITTPAP
jgi:hypothetical protein